MRNTKVVMVLASVAIAGVVAGAASRLGSPHARKLKGAQLGELLRDVDSQLSLFNQAWAEGNESCDTANTEAIAACVKSNSAYAHGALNYFNNMLCMLNKQTGAQAENALCHLTKSMEMNPDKKALPVTITKTFGSKSVVMTVSVPTESFATTLGYDAKGVVTVDGTTSMTIYWGGNDTSSKGFMIQGPAGLKAGDKHLSYIQWDRTDSSNQFIKILATRFSSSYLGTINANSGDTAMYGKATYNSSTKAVSTQMVRIEGQRGGTASTKACFRMLATGTKGGTVSVIKTENSKGSTGHAATHATTTITDETDAFQGTDSTTTVNGTGNVTTAATGVTTAFDKTCSFLNSAGGASQPFASNAVDFAMNPTTLFP